MKGLIYKNRVFIRQLCMILMDSCCVAASGMFALFIRYEFEYGLIDRRFIDNYLKYLPVQILTTLLLFYFFRLYHAVWKFASINEFSALFCACVIAGLCQFGGCHLWGGYLIGNKGAFLPRSFYFLSGAFLFAFAMAFRFGYRMLYHYIHKRRIGIKGANVMIIGAGAAASMLIREIKSSEYINKKVRCLIDDSFDKQGKYIQGIKVVGGRNSIYDAVEKYKIDEIIIAMPSVSKKLVSEIVTTCQDTGCEMKILPGIYQLLNGDVSVSKLRNVEVEDLLGRDPIKLDMDLIMGYVRDKIILVTGGGGSIGSELCRQIAAKQPKRLIIVDIYENNAYDIQQELIRDYPRLDLVVLIASVRNTIRINKIFEEYRPQVVYHAAAHKHVPLMEKSPNEAVKNNVFGTLKTVQAADRFGTEKFVMISTDKAVNPTNIMGATKRICEMIIQTYNRRSETEFVAVRFGNVLGSNGSVIPLFRKQIAEGGPVTVTHPDIIRYFMTIPEAVSLVIQAGAYAKGGEIFVLDMGEPVKITDLAKNLIKLSGYIPNEDIMIEFTGLRPGEKLYEELLMEEEGMQETANNMIFIGKPIQINEVRFLTQLDKLYAASLKEPDDVRVMVNEIVDTYTYKI